MENHNINIFEVMNKMSFWDQMDSLRKEVTSTDLSLENFLKDPVDNFFGSDQFLDAAGAINEEDELQQSLNALSEEDLDFTKSQIENWALYFGSGGGTGGTGSDTVVASNVAVVSEAVAVVASAMVVGGGAGAGGGGEGGGGEG